MFEFGNVPSTPLERTQFDQDRVHDLLVKVDSSSFDAEMNLRFLEHAPPVDDPEAQQAYERKMELERILAESRVQEAEILGSLYELFDVIKGRLDLSTSQLD